MRSIFSYFKKEKVLCVWFAILGLATVVLSILEPSFTSKQIAGLTTFDLNIVLKYSIYVAITAIIVAIVKYFFRKIAVQIESKVGRSLKKDLCKQALSIKSCFISDFESGELNSITTSDSTELLQKFQQASMYVFTTITSVAAAVYIFYLSWQCASLFAVFLLLIVIIQKKSLKEEKKNSENEKSHNDTVKSLINQIYQGILDIKVLNLTEQIFNKYDTLLNKEMLAAKNKEHSEASNRLFTNITFEVYVLGFMMLGIWLIRSNMLELKDFITIFMFKSSLYNIVFNVSELRSAVSKMKVLADRINKLLKIEPYKIENFGKTDGTSKASHEITVENLSFSYNSNDSDVLKDISFKMSEGEFIGIVGESGSAKSTLISLLSRQLEPTKGSLKLDGIDYHKFSKKSFTNMVSLASQKPYIFSFSIRENLLMIKPDATESELWKALEEAKMLHFVKSLPNGIDTVLTENLNISGGQQQRLSLARLFLKNTPIILMDEATSALDNKTQAEITELIQKKAKTDGTIFVCIAHRIEAIKDADKIMFLENGKIANSGTHNELLKDSKYLKLLNKKALAFS